MTKVRFHFYKGTGIISRLIQLRTYSPYSHVAIEMDGIIYESKEFVGVRSIVPRKTAPKSLADTITFEVHGKEYHETLKWIGGQIGKKYDYMGILLFLGLPRKEKKNNRWYCSEIGAEVSYRLGIKKYQKMSLSPGALYLLLK